MLETAVGREARQEVLGGASITLRPIGGEGVGRYRRARRSSKLLNYLSFPPRPMRTPFVKGS